MRPRSSDRGERPSTCRLGTITSSFNAATVFGPWRTLLTAFQLASSSAVLQCGHGLRTVENHAAAESFHQRGLASMRPRSSDRGELVPLGADGIEAVGFNAATVFGPWRTPRSYALTHTTQQRFNAATVFGPWRTVEGSQVDVEGLRLQCGHGLRTVENQLLVLLPRHLEAGFNAATVFGPWRTLPEVPDLVELSTTLQCGHGLRTVENHGPQGTCCPLRHASMRPRSSDRGERRMRIGMGAQGEASMRPRSSDRGERQPIILASPMSPSFNAATVFGPWRTSGCRYHPAPRSAGFNAATVFGPWRTLVRL